MIRARASAAAMASVLALGCGSGGNSVIREFHPTVTSGSALADAIVRAEQAQKANGSVTGMGVDCPGDVIEIGRGPYGNPFIRVTRVSEKPDSASLAGHTEEGLPTTEAFSKAVAEHLPSFYGCQKFVFTFWRDQLLPTTDSFSVTVDPQGRINTVSELKDNFWSG